MISSSLIHCVLLSAVAVVATALHSLEYSGAHRSSPHPLAPRPGLPHHMPYAFDGGSSSLPGSHGNLYPEHGYAYSGPVSSASFTRRVHGYQGYPGAGTAAGAGPGAGIGAGPGAGAHYPGAFAQQMGQHPYAAALSYNYAPAYAPGFAAESGHYRPNYGAYYVPSYTAHSPGAMPLPALAYRPPYANLYGPAAASYAPAYPTTSAPASAPNSASDLASDSLSAYPLQTDYAPSQQAINPYPSESSGLPIITANKKRSLPVDN